jgi:hypothetical protein
MKMGLKGTHLAIMEDIKSNSMAELREIPKEAAAGASTMAESMEQVCVCKYANRYSGNFLTAHRKR